MSYDVNGRRLPLAHIVQTAIILAGMAIGYGKLSAAVETNGRDFAMLRADHGIMASDVNKLQMDCAAMQARLTQVESQEAASFLARDSDRKLLMDMKGDIAVLLDRTDPKKAK